MSSYTLKAIEWALKPDKLHPERSNWENLVRKVQALKATNKRTIMRNQANVGFSNNYWPTLSRLLIIHDPTNALYIHTRHVDDLDSEKGKEELRALYHDMMVAL